MGHRMAHIRWLRRIRLGGRCVVLDDSEYLESKSTTEPTHRRCVDAKHPAIGILGPNGE